MNTIDFQCLLLKSAVSAMACDGEIAQAELEELQDIASNEVYFLGFDFDALLEHLLTLHDRDGAAFVNDYLTALDDSTITARQKVLVMEVVLRIISSDRKIEDSEVHFLNAVQRRLKLDNSDLAERFPRMANHLADKREISSVQRYKDYFFT